MNNNDFSIAAAEAVATEAIVIATVLLPTTQPSNNMQHERAKFMRFFSYQKILFIFIAATNDTIFSIEEKEGKKSEKKGTIKFI